MTQVLETYVRIARPSGNDPVGAIEVGFYVVKDGALTLTNEHGAPIPSGRLNIGYTTKLDEAEDNEAVAKRLIWRRYRAMKGNSDFNRPLEYHSQRGWR
jgi:hypothetical protein